MNMVIQSPDEFRHFVQTWIKASGARTEQEAARRLDVSLTTLTKFLRGYRQSALVASRFGFELRKEANGYYYIRKREHEYLKSN